MTANENDVPYEANEDLTMAFLIKLWRKNCSEVNFGVHLLHYFFSGEELRNKNVTGRKGKGTLDRVRMEKIKKYYFTIYLCNNEEEVKVEKCALKDQHLYETNNRAKLYTFIVLRTGCLENVSV